MSVYTYRFIRTSVVGTTVRWQVPAGKRAIVTCTCATNGHATAGGVAYVGVAGTWFWSGPLQAGVNAVLATMRVAAYAGEFIDVYLSATVASCIVTGYLFDDTQPPLFADADGVPDPEADLPPAEPEWGEMLSEPF